MKIAVVGAGIFGITSAIKLSERHNITLFDLSFGILNSASGCNQYRLHKGYHYPRSTEMIQSTQEFEREFDGCIVNHGVDRYYAIASNNSLTDKEQYLTFLETSKLDYEIIQNLDLLKCENLDLIVKVHENSFDIAQLYLICTEKLRKCNIDVKLNTQFTKQMMSEFDVVINCTYSNLNFLLSEDDQIDYQFELCEKPVISVGREWKGKSVVIMDGEFCCIDPHGFDEYYHVMGHVKEAIHERHVGNFFAVPSEIRPYLNGGITKGYTNSKYKQIINASRDFFNFNGVPTIPTTEKRLNFASGNVYYAGSMFTVRTVLPNRELDDGRPSYITKHNDQLYSIFSGKIATCVHISNELNNMLK